MQAAIGVRSHSEIGNRVRRVVGHCRVLIGTGRTIFVVSKRFLHYLEHFRSIWTIFVVSGRFLLDVCAPIERASDVRPLRPPHDALTALLPNPITCKHDDDERWVAWLLF